MQGIRPRTLSNRELISYCAKLMEGAYGEQVGMPYEWQVELLRRFIALAPTDEYPPIDPSQMNLF